MALEEVMEVDEITIDEYGNVQVRLATRILRDGVQVTEEYHRVVIDKGEQPTDARFQDDPKLQRIANDPKVKAVISEVVDRQQWRAKPERTGPPIEEGS